LGPSFNLLGPPLYSNGLHEHVMKAGVKVFKRKSRESATIQG
jgi:hypothetical protein